VRVAVLADIHGNLPALEAVQRDLRAVAPDHVIVNGDVVNRGPQSRECVQAVRATGWPVTFGNHEELIIRLARGGVPAEWGADWWLPSHAAAASLSAEEVGWLAALPVASVFEAPGLPALRAVHGSMRALNDGLGAWLDDAELLAAVAGAPEPVVIGAHTHRPFERHLNGRTMLNCGAVGAPFNGDPAAQYLLLHGEGGAWRAEFCAVLYDRQPLYDAWARQDYFARSAAAHVFRYEVETATFHLGAYEQFCAWHGLPKGELASFERYRRHARATTPGRSLHHAPPR